MDDGTSRSPTHTAGTHPPTHTAGTHPPAVGGTQACELRELLDRLGDKWSLLVVELLGDGTKRFTQLLRQIDGISQRMLTVTLRGLERDGIVTRTVYPVVPPRVEYSLTPLGATLMDAAGTFVAWAEDHLGQIDAARAEYDARQMDVQAEDARR